MFLYFLIIDEWDKTEYVLFFTTDTDSVPPFGFDKKKMISCSNTIVKLLMKRCVNVSQWHQRVVLSSNFLFNMVNIFEDIFRIYWKVIRNLKSPYIFIKSDGYSLFVGVLSCLQLHLTFPKALCNETYLRKMPAGLSLFCPCLLKTIPNEKHFKSWKIVNLFKLKLIFCLLQSIKNLFDHVTAVSEIDFGLVCGIPENSVMVRK